MIDRSPIEWTGVTWNPWQGCRKVSAGCAHCYMYRDLARFGKDPAVVRRSANPTFYRPRKWQKEVEAGLRAGRDRLVFACSWSDWFIEEADAWRQEAWHVIRGCPDLVFQILTKRPERIPGGLPSFWDEIKGRCWMGVTVENEDVVSRIEELHLIDCAVRWVSYEPAVGPVYFSPWLQQMCSRCLGQTDDDGCYECHGAGWIAGRCVDWIVAGGESGPNARPSHPDWFRGARDLCTDHRRRVPFFFKQWGEWGPCESSGVGPLIHCFTDDGRFIDAMAEAENKTVEMICRFGKRATGRRLDDQTWNEMPAIPEVFRA